MNNCFVFFFFGLCLLVIFYVLFKNFVRVFVLNFFNVVIIKIYDLLFIIIFGWEIFLCLKSFFLLCLKCVIQFKIDGKFWLFVIIEEIGMFIFFLIGCFRVSLQYRNFLLLLFLWIMLFVVFQKIIFFFVKLWYSCRFFLD